MRSIRTGSPSAEQLAFAHFGGVPGRIRYDNLGPAVVRVLRGRDRAESERFVALRSHFGFDTFFCRPGKEGAHEKGGVEGEIGRFRRRHLVPVPNVAGLAELNGLIAAGDAADDARVITGRTVTVGAAFAAEAPLLLPLPANGFDSARLLTARVDTRSRVGVRQSYYSVPARLVGRRVAVRLSATTVEAFDAGRRVALHERAFGRYVEVLDLDHYLEVLSFLTAAAPNRSAMTRTRPERLADIPIILRRRATRILDVAAAHGHRRLVLGAWGCEVFGNDRGACGALVAGGALVAVG